MSQVILNRMASQPAKSKRRWVQFSLRTGFIVVTALCLGLSVWIVPLERKRRAVAAIEAMGGSVTYRAELIALYVQRIWEPRNERRRSVYLDEVVMVSLFGTQVTDAGVAHLLPLTSLSRLELNGTQVTDAALAHLQGLKGLKWLDLRNTQVTKAGVARLQKALPNCQIKGP